MRISDYLATAAARWPEKEALVYDNTRFTYDQVKRHSDRVAIQLQREPGLQPGAHVAVYSPNDHLVPICQFGVNRADMAWIGVHDRNSLETNARVMDAMDCDLIFFNSTYEEAIPQLKQWLPRVQRWICTDAVSKHAPSLDEWLDAGSQELPYVEPDRDATACIAPTGGTTGPSKGAVHTHHSLEMEVINVASTLNMKENTRLLTVAPLSHAAGHFALGLLPWAGTNVILRGFDAETALRTIATERITHLFVPPTIVYMLLAHPTLKQHDLRSISHLIVGAAPIAPEKFREAVRVFGPVLYEAYAQSESAIPILVKRPSDYYRDGSFDEAALCSAGRAIPNTRVEIMDDDGHLLSRGERGEIVTRSSMGMAAYYKNEEATREAAAHGFHHTGDIGVMDERGFVTILDRKKDMIITGGFNVFPTEVEAAINEHPAVLDCIVVGVPDEKWGEAIKAVVQLKQGVVVSGQELIDLCQIKLGGVKSPKSVEIWPDLPRSAVGKTLRREVRAKFWEGQWRAV